ncbi:MAG: hypothetical protein DRJ60_05495 [Thermoprotei archaeon]|nr:MAG: hypothetical protein DRJ60_05495 [Thermoprotei archaeon]
MVIGMGGSEVTEYAIGVVEGLLEASGDYFEGVDAVLTSIVEVVSSEVTSLRDALRGCFIGLAIGFFEGGAKEALQRETTADDYAVLYSIIRTKSSEIEEKISEYISRRDVGGAEERTCPQCGSPIEPDDNFCPACGAKLR